MTRSKLIINNNCILAMKEICESVQLGKSGQIVKKAVLEFYLEPNDSSDITDYIMQRCKEISQNHDALEVLFFTDNGKDVLMHNIMERVQPRQQEWKITKMVSYGR